MHKKINLNSFIFNEQITKEDILSVITQEEIYSYYIGSPVEHSTKINSPLREDNVPSFVIYYHKNGSGTLMFYDFATKDSGDVIVFVGLLYDINYKEALWKIAYDFKLSDAEITGERKQLVKAKKVIQRKQVKIGIKRREWQSHDAKYWKQYGIKKTT